MLGDVSGLARPYRVEFRDRICGPVEMVVVPRGVEHRTAADDEAEIILLEPAGVLNTGNITDQKFTAHPWSIFWTAYPLDVKQLERGAPARAVWNWRRLIPVFIGSPSFRGGECAELDPAYFMPGACEGWCTSRLGYDRGANRRAFPAPDQVDPG
jgi:hypothetical protein